MEATAREMGGSERQQFRTKLCSEELLTNLLRHGKSAPTVALTLQEGASRLTLTIEYGGAFFDPTQAPEGQPHEELNDAQPGGWGLTLIRRFAEDFTYQHSRSRNLVQLSFLP